MKKILFSITNLLLIASPSLALADGGEGHMEFARGSGFIMGHMFGGYIMFGLVIIFLVLGIVYFWKGINKK